MQMSFMNCNIKPHQIITGVQNLLLHQVSQGCKKRRRDSLVITSITYVDSGASLKFYRVCQGFWVHGIQWFVSLEYGIFW